MKFLCYYRLLYRALLIDQQIWVGITDQAEEGVWMWVNGWRAVNSALFWERNNPSNSRDIENCGELLVHSSVGYLSLNDVPCYFRRIAVCEKPIKEP